MARRVAAILFLLALSFLPAAYCQGSEAEKTQTASTALPEAVLNRLPPDYREEARNLLNDAIVEMTNPGVWILGSTDDDARGNGLGVVVEYAGKQGTANRGRSSGPSWDYTLFGKDQESPMPDETIPMVIERVPPDANGLEGWTINGKSYRGKDDLKILCQGRRYRLIFDNRTGDPHPLHLHRNTFELARVNGKPTTGLKKDVVTVAAYQTVEVDFTPEESGLTLFHCHQQLHMDHGFKRLFDIR